MRNSLPAIVALLTATFAGAFPAAVRAQTIDDVGSVAPVLDLCVTRALRGNAFAPRRDATVRLAFRRDGSIIGRPAVSYSLPRRGDPEQERFIGAILKAIEGCTPLPFSNGLGGAIAGKIFVFRYTLTDAKDQTL
jgi:hypothetical protein